MNESLLFAYYFAAAALSALTFGLMDYLALKDEVRMSHLIIKVRLGNDFRRVMVTNEEQTYDEFVLMMQRVFGHSLPHDSPLVIKYQDDGSLPIPCALSSCCFEMHSTQHCPNHTHTP